MSISQKRILVAALMKAAPFWASSSAIENSDFSLQNIHEFIDSCSFE
jgi:hypothetical protein